jgi:multidrug resistance protein MdtO
VTVSTTRALDATTRAASPEERQGALARLWPFLRTELAPSRARWRATLRLTLACVAAAALVMTLRLPYGHWFVITIFIVSQPNVGASIDKAILRLAGTVLGAAGVIVSIVAFPQQPWFFVPLVAGLIFAGVFLSRTVTYPYVAFLGSITVVIFLTTDADQPWLSVTDGLWRVGAVALAEVVATSAQLLLWPDDPEDLLLDDLVAILGTVEGRLARLLAGDVAGLASDGARRLRDDAFNGLARHMDLLSNAETRYRSLRRRHTEQLVLIAAVNRIAVASLTLDTLLRERSAAGRGTALGDALRRRADALRDRVAELRAGLAARSPLAGPAPDEERPALVGPHDAPLLPPIVEMERALRDVPAATAFLDPTGATAPPDALSSFLDGGPVRFFTPACSFANVRDLRFAAQVTIAAMICYLLVTGLHWPGIFTAVVTCLFVAQTSFGATVQKALLRLAGALLGGVIGVLTILVVVPNFDSLPPFLIAVAIGSGIAAYVATGSARISYVGIQIGFALAMCIFDTWGPSVELTRPRDRVIGVLIGNVVTAVVMLSTWPVLASKDMVRSLESALRHMAQLSLVGISGGVDERVARPARGFRLQIFQDLGAVLRMHGEAQFEPGATSTARQAEQARLLELLHGAQAVFLLVLALVRNRRNVALASTRLPTTARTRELALAVAPALEAAADELTGTPPRPLPPFAELVRAAEASFAADRERVGDGPDGRAALALVRGQIELYRDLAPELERLRTLARAARAP